MKVMIMIDKLIEYLKKFEGSEYTNFNIDFPSESGYGWLVSIFHMNHSSQNYCGYAQTLEEAIEKLINLIEGDK